METLLFSLLACLSVGVLTLVAVTAQRLTGKVTLELELGGRSLAQARDAASLLRDELERTRASEARVSGGAQALRGDVTRDVTAQPSLVTRPLNATAKVTAHLDDGTSFTVPQDNVPPVTEG